MRSIGGINASRHAITDLYDEERRTFLIKYPVWFVITLSLAGVVAFALTGFFGWLGRSDTSGVDGALRQPWVLFLWFCALIITLQVSIFRNQSLRRRLAAILIISLLCVVFIGITYFSSSLPEVLRRLLEQGKLLRLLASSSVTYIVINFGLIAIFWTDTIRRWIRRARGLPPNPRVDIGFEKLSVGFGGADDMPSLAELISGDLMAGAVFVLLLAGIFRTEVLANFIHTSPPINSCTLSWFGMCGQGGTIKDPPTLTFIDLIQTLIYLPLGLIILALTATLSGLGAVGGVNDKELESELPATASKDESSTVPITADVTQTLINTLKSALDRRLRLLLSNLILSLRTVGWPALIFLAVYGLAELSTNIQYYLHSGKDLTALLIYVLPALGWGLLSALSVIFSAALMLFRWRVADNTLRFLGLIGFVVLLTFWIFSLSLWVVNELLLQTHAMERHPFDPPGWTTGISFVILLIFAAQLLFRRVRGPRATGGRAPAMVSAGTPASRGADPSATTAAGAPSAQRATTTSDSANSQRE